MSGVNALAKDIIYVYDGSYDGFLCCVFESVYKRELPSEIWREEYAPLTFLDTRFIETDANRAARVAQSIPQRISYRAAELVQTVFLSCLPQKELKMLTFLHRGYNDGARLLYSLGDSDVAPLLDAERRLLHEAHMYTGFVRFSDIGGALISTIAPRNYILPFISRHFLLRYESENFIIFDKTNKAALTYAGGRAEIINTDNIEFPEITETEVRYRELWKRFYDTIAIEARINPRRRMSHMPKRYWEYLPEVNGLL